MGGNRTKAGALQDLNNSITRYIRNNFQDGPRQDGFDLFLGAYRPDEAGIGAANQFIDRRPLLVQAVPYVLGFCVFFIAVSVTTNRMPDSTVWPLRMFTLLCMGVAGYTGNFMMKFGLFMSTGRSSTRHSGQLKRIKIRWKRRARTPSLAHSSPEVARLMGNLVRWKRARRDGSNLYAIAGVSIHIVFNIVSTAK